MLFQKECTDFGTPFSVLTILSRFDCVMLWSSVLVQGRFSTHLFSLKKVAKSWRWYSFYEEGNMLLPFFNWTSAIPSIKGILTLIHDLVRAFLEMGYMKSRSRTIAFMLLLALLHSWTKASKVATVFVLLNSFPMFPCIGSAAMNVWPFSRYMIVLVSDPDVFTHCARPVNKYQFLFWLLQLSAHSQMWSSLHWRINCRNADATSGALRPAIALCQGMQ